MRERMPIPSEPEREIHEDQLDELKDNKNLDIEPRVLAQITDDLRDLYKSAEDPIAVLLQTMDTEEFKHKMPEDLAKKVRAKLNKLEASDEDDFISKVLESAGPIFEISAKDKKDAYKQEGREMYSEDDMDMTLSAIQENGAEKVYIIGNVGSGKTTFSRELSRATEFKNVDVDKYFQIFRQETGQEAKGLAELMNFIIDKETPPYILNHADLLQSGLIPDNADIVIRLNPKKEELLESRRLRTHGGAEGEWKNVDEADYDAIEQKDRERFDELGGRLVHENKDTGTSVRLLKKN